MMNPEVKNLDEILDQLETALDQKDLVTAAILLQSLRVADQAELVNELDEEDTLALLPHLPPADSADILEELDDEYAAELMAELPTETVVRIVDEMEPDEAADLLGDLEPEQARAVLAAMEDPDEIRPLLLHRDESAGGLMTSDFLALRRRMTAAEALQAIREWSPESETIYYLYVVDASRLLCGVISLRQLVVADPKTPIITIMETEVISVVAGTDQEEVARVMSRYDLIAIPVVDEDNHLIGVITIDDVVDVLEEEASEDIQRLGGAEPLDRPYLDTPAFTMARKRIGWLLLLFVSGSLTASVMELFAEEARTVIELAVFIPLLLGTGGNAGSQTTSTIIRALAVGDIDTKDALLALWHELRSSLIMGLTMGVIAYLGVFFVAGIDHKVALTVSFSILSIIIWANTLGALLPILAAKLKIDPTVVSGPAMSTLVDATGLFIYFTIARWIIGL
ncbi:MAG: magnesium transporter [Anaerolineales bacterium]|nr:magnesium transporter [Anaerolineales bacterium]